MKKFLTTTLFALATLSATDGAPPPVVSLDSFIDWKDPLGTMSLEKVKKFCAASPGLRERGVLEIMQQPDKSKALTFPAKMGSVPMQMGSRKMGVRSVTVGLNAKGEGRSIYYAFDPGDLDPVDLASIVVQELSMLDGGAPPAFVKGQRGYMIMNKAKGSNELTPTDCEEYVWERPAWNFRLARRKMDSGLWGRWELLLYNKEASMSPMFGRIEGASPERSPGVAADLDRLLEFGTIWTVSPAEFANLYVDKDALNPKEVLPQFRWLKQEKETARFSRNMFYYSPAKLTLFAGAVKVQEAEVDFVKGTPARTRITLYNEEMEPMARPDFQALFKKVGQSLGGLLKVTPQRQSGSSSGRSVAWRWTTPQGTALLEHNDYEIQGASGKPEYLRLTLTPQGRTN